MKVKDLRKIGETYHYDKEPGWYVEMNDKSIEGPYKTRSQARESLKLLKTVKEFEKEHGMSEEIAKVA